MSRNDQPVFIVNPQPYSPAVLSGAPPSRAVTPGWIVASAVLGMSFWLVVLGLLWLVEKFS
jgi:hypothetical protein